MKIPDDIALALGKMTINASACDGGFAILFQWLLQSPDHRAAPVYYSTTSAKARLDMVRVVLPAANVEKKARERIEKLLERASKLANLRNTFVHSMWAVNDSGETFLISYTPGRKRKLCERKTNATEIEELVAAYRALVNDIIQLLTDVGAKPLSLPDKFE